MGNPFLRTDFVGGLFEGPVIFLVPSDCFFWGSGFGKDVVLVKLFFFFIVRIVQHFLIALSC